MKFTLWLDPKEYEYVKAQKPGWLRRLVRHYMEMHPQQKEER